MPSEVSTPRWQDDPFRSVAYLIEFQSFPGFSGSPVIWFQEYVINTPLSGGLGTQEIRLIPALLGCINGHIPRTQKSDVTGDVLGEITTKINTGIAVVTPSSAVRDLLMHADLIAQWKLLLDPPGTPPNSTSLDSDVKKIGPVHEPNLPAECRTRLWISPPPKTID